jgi:predicted ArsR family transcriptional regulator
VTLLVEGVGSLNGTETSEDARRRALFRRAAATLAERHRPELTGLAGDARVERVAAILRSHGGFAEYHVRGEEFELRDFSCVFRANVGGGGRCEWHETFLEEALGAPVRPAPPPDDGCADCCNYIITVRADAQSSVTAERGQS